MKLDILAIAAHPDDVELCCSGTILKHIALGYKVGIVDLTRGELGTRGNGPLRIKEAQTAADYMGVLVRENLNLPDGFFDHSQGNKLKIIKMIRRYQPELVLCNAITDRHPDHGRASKLVSDSCFLSGLVKVKTFEGETPQDKWRPKIVYHYIQDRYIHPDLCIDVSDYIDQKEEAILKFKSQFYDPNSSEPDSMISGKDFLDFVRARSRDFGRLIGAEFGEGFTVERPIGADHFFKLT